MNEVLTGIVKWWDERKGYGYITVAQDGEYRDYFAHYKNIISDHRFKKLHYDWVVHFVPNYNEKGYYGTDICLIAKNSKYVPGLKTLQDYLDTLND